MSACGVSYAVRSAVRGALRRVAACLVVATAASIPGARALAQPASATMDSARAAAASGQAERAIALYLGHLKQDSTSRLALRELAALYAGLGKWPDALPLLKRLSAVGESDFALERDLGQWLSWSGQADSGLVHLRKAARLEPDSVRLRLTLGQTLTWNARTRAEGLTILRELERAHPVDRDVRHALASPLTWDSATRPEGLSRLAALVKDDPNALDIAVEYANVLSWIPSSRTAAMQEYQRVAERAPDNIGAARGRLNILTWSGRVTDALIFVDSALRLAPKDTALLQGKASILVSIGRPSEAVAILSPLVAASPTNKPLVEQLGYAMVASGQFRGARRLADRLPAGSSPSGADWIRRGASTTLGADASGTDNSFGFFQLRYSLRTSIPVSAAGRLSLSGGVNRYGAVNDQLQANNVNVAFDQRLARRVVARFEAGATQFPGIPTAWTGGIDIENALATGVSLRLSARRSVIEDTRRSATGLSESGRVVGQVRSNALALSLRAPSGVAGIVLTGNLGVGAYTGRSLRTNIRREVGLTATRSIAIGARGTRLDVSSGFNYFGFAYNALGGGKADELGGYWSPTGIGGISTSLGLSMPITGRLTWSTSGSVTRQIIGLHGGPNPLAYVANSDLGLIGRAGWDASAGLFYIDNFSGFRMRQGRVGISHTF